MAMDVKIEGFKDLEKALLELKTATARGVVRRAMKTAFVPFVAAAEAAAPVGPTGNLKGSIGVSSRLTRNQSREARGTVDRNSTVVMYAGSGARHAHLVEFGTGPRYQKNGRYVGEMPPNGFMRGAWDVTRHSVLALLQTEMGAEVMKSVARAERKALREQRKAAEGRR